MEDNGAFYTFEQEEQEKEFENDLLLSNENNIAKTNP